MYQQILLILHGVPRHASPPHHMARPTKPLNIDEGSALYHGEPWAPGSEWSLIRQRQGHPQACSCCACSIDYIRGRRRRLTGGGRSSSRCSTGHRGKPATWALPVVRACPFFDFCLVCFLVGWGFFVWLGFFFGGEGVSRTIHHSQPNMPSWTVLDSFLLVYMQWNLEMLKKSNSKISKSTLLN